MLPPFAPPATPAGGMSGGGRAIADAVAAHYDCFAEEYAARAFYKEGYYQEVKILLRHLVPPGRRVLDVGCSAGELLDWLRPSCGVGIDISGRTVDIARKRYAQQGELRFIQGDACDEETFKALGETFDTICLTGVIQEMRDVQAFLHGVRACCKPQTRLILLGYSRLWQWPLEAAEWFGLKQAQPVKNWLPKPIFWSLLRACDFEIVKEIRHLVFPLPPSGITRFLNKYLGHLPVVDALSLISGFLARPVGTLPNATARPPAPSCSVVIPCRNEAGHIQELHQRLPALPAGSEVIWVEGNSTDNTEEVIRKLLADHPEKPYHFLKQPGRGKGDAVCFAFSRARGDILLILDADITVPPEDIPKFLSILQSDKAEFVNGTRLVYPMHSNAMRFLNLLGNKFFALVFKKLLGQDISDTLCGTKVMWRGDYEHLAANRGYFGDLDPFGDFDLLLGASRMHLQIMDLPVRYDERRYGETNISRFSHGWLLLKMAGVAARKIYFI